MQKLKAAISSSLPALMKKPGMLGELERQDLPSTTSAWLAQLSENIMRKVAEAEKIVGTAANKEFNSTITDLKMLSNLALYHARRCQPQ